MKWKDITQRLTEVKKTAIDTAQQYQHRLNVSTVGGYSYPRPDIFKSNDLNTPTNIPISKSHGTTESSPNLTHTVLSNSSSYHHINQTLNESSLPSRPIPFLGDDDDTEHMLFETDYMSVTPAQNQHVSPPVSPLIPYNEQSLQYITDAPETIIPNLDLQTPSLESNHLLSAVDVSSFPNCISQIQTGSLIEDYPTSILCVSNPKESDTLFESHGHHSLFISEPSETPVEAQTLEDEVNHNTSEFVFEEKDQTDTSQNDILIQTLQSVSRDKLEKALESALRKLAQYSQNVEETHSKLLKECNTSHILKQEIQMLQQETTLLIQCKEELQEQLDIKNQDIKQRDTEFKIITDKLANVQLKLFDVETENEELRQLRLDSSNQIDILAEEIVQINKKCESLQEINSKMASSTNDLTIQLEKAKKISHHFYEDILPTHPTITINTYQQSREVSLIILSELSHQDPLNHLKSNDTIQRNNFPTCSNCLLHCVTLSQETSSLKEHFISARQFARDTTHDVTIVKDPSLYHHNELFHLFEHIQHHSQIGLDLVLSLIKHISIIELNYNPHPCSNQNNIECPNNLDSSSNVHLFHPLHANLTACQDQLTSIQLTNLNIMSVLGFIPHKSTYSVDLHSHQSPDVSSPSITKFDSTTNVPHNGTRVFHDRNITQLDSSFVSESEDMGQIRTHEYFIGLLSQYDRLCDDIKHHIDILTQQTEKFINTKLQHTETGINELLPHMMPDNILLHSVDQTLQNHIFYPVWTQLYNSMLNLNDVPLSLQRLQNAFQWIIDHFDKTCSTYSLNELKLKHAIHSIIQLLQHVPSVHLTHSIQDWIKQYQLIVSTIHDTTSVSSDIHLIRTASNSIKEVPPPPPPPLVDLSFSTQYPLAEQVIPLITELLQVIQIQTVELATLDTESGFSNISATVDLVMQTIEERLPLIGRQELGHTVRHLFSSIVNMAKHRVKLLNELKHTHHEQEIFTTEFTKNQIDVTRTNPYPQTDVNNVIQQMSDKPHQTEHILSNEQRNNQDDTLSEFEAHLHILKEEKIQYQQLLEQEKDKVEKLTVQRTRMRSLITQANTQLVEAKSKLDMCRLSTEDKKKEIQELQDRHNQLKFKFECKHYPPTKKLLNQLNLQSVIILKVVIPNDDRVWCCIRTYPIINPLPSSPVNKTHTESADSSPSLDPCGISWWLYDSLEDELKNSELATLQDEHYLKIVEFQKALQQLEAKVKFLERNLKSTTINFEHYKEKALAALVQKQPDIETCTRALPLYRTVSIDATSLDKTEDSEKTLRYLESRLDQLQKDFINRNEIIHTQEQQLLLLQDKLKMTEDSMNKEIQLRNITASEAENFRLRSETSVKQLKEELGKKHAKLQELTTNLMDLRHINSTLQYSVQQLSVKTHGGISSSPQRLSSTCSIPDDNDTPPYHPVEETPSSFISNPLQQSNIDRSEWELEQQLQQMSNTPRDSIQLNEETLLSPHSPSMCLVSTSGVLTNQWTSEVQSLRRKVRILERQVAEERHQQTLLLQQNDCIKKELRKSETLLSIRFKKNLDTPADGVPIEFVRNTIIRFLETGIPGGTEHESLIPVIASIFSLTAEETRRLCDRRRRQQHQSSTWLLSFS